MEAARSLPELAPEDSDGRHAVVTHHVTEVRVRLQAEEVVREAEALGRRAHEVVAAALEQIQRHLEVARVEQVVRIETRHVATTRTLDPVIAVVAHEVAAVGAQQHRRARRRLGRESPHRLDRLGIVGAAVDYQYLAEPDCGLGEHRGDRLLDVGAVVETDHHHTDQRKLSRPRVGPEGDRLAPDGLGLATVELSLDEPACPFLEAGEVAVRDEPHRRAEPPEAEERNNMAQARRAPHALPGGHHSLRANTWVSMPSSGRWVANSSGRCTPPPDGGRHMVRSRIFTEADRSRRRRRVGYLVRRAARHAFRTAAFSTSPCFWRQSSFDPHCRLFRSPRSRASVLAVLYPR